MGTINKTTAYINKFLTPQYFGYKKDDDTPDEVTIVASGVYQTYIPDTSNMTLFATDDFTYTIGTGEITYIGEGGYYDIDGSVSIGDIATPNSIVHFAICSEGSVVAEGSAKTETNTAVENLSLNTFLTPFPLTTGDVLTIDIKSTQANGTTLNVFHVQGKIKLVKPI